MIRTLTLCLVLAAACGGKQSAPATTQTAEPGGPPAGGMGKKQGLSPEMWKFHEALAPRWHAAPGPQRMKDTCDAVPQFQADADAIAKATPPTQANADTWTAGTRALVAAVADLATTCNANDTAKFDEAFGKVHDSFHALMAVGGMHHGEDSGEHGAHEHGDHPM